MTRAQAIKRYGRMMGPVSAMKYAKAMDREDPTPLDAEAREELKHAAATVIQKRARGYMSRKSHAKGGRGTRRHRRRRTGH